MVNQEDRNHTGGIIIDSEGKMEIYFNFNRANQLYGNIIKTSAASEASKAFEA